MSKYQAYPEYKDSGIEWIGDIPKHWELWKLTHAYEEIGSGTTPPSTDAEWYGGTVPLVTTGELREKEIYSTTKNVTDDALRSFTALRKYPKGSIAIAMYGATIGRLGIFGVEATTNQACCVFTKSSVVDNHYLYYWLQAFRQDIVNLASGGGQPNINQEVVASLKVSCPDKVGQEIIVSFLDHETTKIDTLIDKQQQLIQLLKEKRQAVISHAVTKGLNPNAPMHDSGVEWLGEVPEHWSFPKVKWFFKTESGGTPNTSRYEEYYQDGDIPWIRSTDLNNNELFETPIAITSKAIRESACTVIPTNSVLIAMYGGAGTIGKHALLKFESAINQAVCAILPTNKINPDFLHLYVEFYRPYWMVGAEGARKDPNINQETIRELVVSSPPYDEQVEIVKVIQQKIAVIDQTVSKCEKNIQLMQERRTALISAAVTGKIDVRDWQDPALMQNKEAV